MSQTSYPRKKRPVPWRGRRRVPDPKDKFVAVRCTPEQHTIIRQAAMQAGLSVGAYLRAIALGQPGPRAVRHIPLEQQELARLLGWVGKLGGNVNQMAKVANTNGNLPAQAMLGVVQADVFHIRAAIVGALGRGSRR